ncbi:MAG: S8 family serine peptidase [Euryarchaeota archaeon]|nr:S8 family serine peptidase [Euryarchaeota archaeon]
MDKRKIVSRALVILLALAMAIPVSIAMQNAQKPEALPSTEEFVRIQLKNPADVNSLKGLDIIEAYDGFAIARISGTQKTALAANYAVERVPDPAEFSFNGYSFNVLKEQPPIPAELKMKEQSQEWGYYFVQFKGPIKQEWIGDVVRTGAKNYQPSHAYGILVGMSAEQKAMVEKLDSVLWVGNYEPAYKIGSEFAGVTGMTDIRILTFPEFQGTVTAQVAKMMSRTGLGKFFSDYTIPKTIVNGRVGDVRLSVDASLVQEIAKLQDVMYVEKWEQPKMHNDVCHSQMQSGTATSIGAPASLNASQAPATNANTPVWWMGIYGQNSTGAGGPRIVIGQADSGIRVDHNMFLSTGYTNANIPLNVSLGENTHRKIARYVVFESAQYDRNPTPGGGDHGTHVAGTIAGYDNPSGGASAYDGQAPGARISFGDIGNTSGTYVYPPEDYTQMWWPVLNDSGRVDSNSWGSGYNDRYTADEQMIDQWVYDHPTFLFAWSAGNDGAAQTIGNQPAAKNAIAIGGVLRTNCENYYTTTSRGPTYDGRVKPDILATGSNVNSADSTGTNTYTLMSGTSMASPNAIGAIATMNQYFLEGWYPTGAKVAANAFDPSHSLIKAVAINGAKEIAGTNNGWTTGYNNGNGLGAMNYPNVYQGWGRINSSNALYFSGDAQKLQVFDGDNGVETGKYFEYKYRLASVNQFFNVTIVWNDYPSTPGTAAALVNDLDLTVTSPTGTVFKGNAFTVTGAVYPHYSQPATAATADHRNNIEVVRVRQADTVAGVWTVRITGYNVPNGPQPFSIALSGDLDLDYGVIQLDRDVYGMTQTANIRIEDAGAGAGPLQARINATVSGFSETVNCVLTGTGVYLGTVSFTTNYADPAGNGVLPVTTTDIINASYTDVSGTAHVTWALASIDGEPPVITNVRTGTITMASAEILWNCSKNANGTVYYGTSPASLSLTAKVNSPYKTAITVPVYGLTINTLYYFDVESTDLRGNKIRDSNGGNHYTFTTQSKGDILVIANGPYRWDFIWPAYKNAIEIYGWKANSWVTWLDGDAQLATMQNYSAVIWQVGSETYPPFSAAEQTLVKNYFDGGGRMLIVSHDVMWAFGDATSPYYSVANAAFTNAQMKSTWQVDPASWTTQIGIAADPISGAYTGGLVYQGFRSGGFGDEVNSVAAGGTTTYVWRDTGGTATPDDDAVKWISSANNGTAGAGKVWGGTPSRMCGYWFEMSALQSNSSTTGQTQRDDIINKTITWLIGHYHPTVAISYPNGGESLPGPTVPVYWNKTTYGAGVANQALYYSPNNGSAWYLIAQTPTIAIGATSYTWDISGLPRGNDYLVKMIVTDDLVPGALSGEDQSNAVFSITTPDTVGPIVVAGTARAAPNPVNTSATVWYNATIDDSNTGDSNIAQAEYFIGAPGASGTGTAMNVVDAAWDEVNEPVTLQTTAPASAGTYMLSVHGRDAAGNWGSYAYYNFTVNTGGGPPPWYPWINITVVLGWNLISVPYVGPSAMPGALTDMVNGGAGLVVWDRVMAYNTSTPANLWKQYNTGWAAGLNDLSTVDNKMGVWINVVTLGDANICLGGSAYSNATTTATSIYAGWNLVGFPSDDPTYTVAQLKVDTGATIVEGFSGAATYKTAVLADATNLVAGNAYWIYCPAPTTWTKAW